MNRVISGEIFKVKKCRVTYIMMAVTIIVALLQISMLIPYVKMPEQMPFGLEITQWNGIAVMKLFSDVDTMFIIIGIFTAIIFCMDYTTGSMRQIIGKGVEKRNYILGSLSVSSGVGFLYLAAFEAVLFLCGTLLGGATGVSGVEEIKFIGLVAVSSVLSSIFYVSYVSLLSTIFRRLSITIILAILTPSLAEVFGRVLTAITGNEFFDTHGLMNLAGNIYNVECAVSERIISIAVLLGMTVLFNIAAIVIFKKRDLD